MTDDGPQTENGWVKLHRSALASNSSVRKLRPGHRALFYDYLMLARYRSPFKGCLCTQSGTPLSIRQRAELSGCDKDFVNRADREMLHIGLLTERQNGLLHITNYERYQATKTVASEGQPVSQRRDSVSHPGDSKSEKLSHPRDRVSHPGDKTVASEGHGFENDVSHLRDKQEDAFHPQLSHPGDTTPEKLFDSIDAEEIVFLAEVSHLGDSEENGLADELSLKRDAKKVVRTLQDNNNVVRTGDFDESPDDFTALLLLSEIGLPTATAKRLADNCYEEDLEQAIQAVEYIRDHPDEYRKPIGAAISAVEDGWEIEEARSAETGITGAQAQGNAQIEAMDWSEWEKQYDEPRSKEELADEVAAPSILEQAVHNVQALVDDGLDLEIALYRLGNIASQPWSDDFKQQISAQITELPETANTGPIKREFGEPGGGDAMI